MNKFLQAYITCALWSSNDNADDSGGEPLDKNYSISDIATECLERMSLGCKEFQEKNKELLEQSGMDEARAGHCFWLSRGGHGSGYFDEYSATICDEWTLGLPIKKQDELDKTCPCKYHVCQRLQEAAQACGDFDLYVGDDGKIYA